MAEIHVQAKKHQSSNSWIWIVIGLLIVGALIYFLMRNKDNDTNNRVINTGNTGAWVQPAQQTFYELRA
jgi:hypothetical protein